MKALRIYADFNGLVRSSNNPERVAVVLDTFGSARDLANAGVKLYEGLPLIGVDWSDENEDLEGHGIAKYDKEHKWWVIEFDETGVRYVPAGDRTVIKKFLCVSCRKDLGPAISAHELATAESCPECGTPIFASLEEPEEK